MFFIDDLLEEVNKELEYYNGEDSQIKRRQLFDDIRFMESDSGWAIPLERIRYGKKVYYRYEDEKFSIKNQKINDEEIDAINSALIILHRFKDFPMFGWVNELSTKLQSLFQQSNIPEIVCFDHNEYLNGLEHLPTLYQYIINHQTLSIEYQSFRYKEPYSLTIHPYYLKQYNKRWFLFGLNDSAKQLYNLPLDRIKSIQPASTKYIETDIDFNEYFEDIVGVSVHKDLHPIKIHLLLDKEIAPYILTKPIHGSQKKIREDDTSVELEIEVIPNFELKQLLLSYGSGLEVISPESYRNDMISTINQMNNKYIDKKE
jgi:predicted DNA-binding transcriptional regulator YafY